MGLVAMRGKGTLTGGGILWMTGLQRNLETGGSLW
jgi:hypothetical protein